MGYNFILNTLVNALDLFIQSLLVLELFWSFQNTDSSHMFIPEKQLRCVCRREVNYLCHEFHVSGSIQLHCSCTRPITKMTCALLYSRDGDVPSNSPLSDSDGFSSDADCHWENVTLTPAFHGSYFVAELSNHFHYLISITWHILFKHHINTHKRRKYFEPAIVLQNI